MCQLLEHKLGLDVVGGEQVRQTLGVISAAATPGNVAQVESVVNAKVDKRRQALLVNGIP